MPSDSDQTTTGAARSAVKGAKPTSPLIKILIELGPLLVFFIAFNKLGIFQATAFFMGAMLLAIGLSYWREGSISPMLWVTFIIVTVLGGLTLYLQDETFVKMKPTLVNGLFSTTLLGGLMVGRPLLKTVMGAGLPEMSPRGWVVLTRNWALFFGSVAVLNELIWRSVDTDTWVTIKTFGYLPLTFAFALSQIPVMMKHGAKFDGGD